MIRDPDYVYAVMLPFAVMGMGLLMLDWAAQVIPVLTAAARLRLLRKETTWDGMW